MKQFLDMNWSYVLHSLRLISILIVITVWLQQLYNLPGNLSVMWWVFFYRKLPQLLPTAKGGMAWSRWTADPWRWWSLPHSSTRWVFYRTARHKHNKQCLFMNEWALLILMWSFEWEKNLSCIFLAFGASVVAGKRAFCWSWHQSQSEGWWTRRTSLW